jgi:uncharacterized protein (TIRG00374 family)
MADSHNKTSVESPPASFHIGRRNLIYLGLLLLLLYIVIPQINKFHKTLSIVRHINFDWLIIGFGFVLATYTMAALSYYLLAKHPLRYLRTLLMQGASMFANLLLPAGVGSISIGFEYLKKNHHTSSQAASVVTLNNLLGFVGNMILLVLVVLFAHTSLNIPSDPHIYRTVAIIALIILIIGLIVLYRFKHLRHSLVQFLIGVRQNIWDYRRHPIKLITSLLSLMSLTSLYTLSLWACDRAVGLHITFAQALIVLTIGVASKTVTPTPGGLIGAEAGLFAGLVAYGANSADALAVTLTYRLLTYWIPFVMGAVAFLIVQRKQYI